MRCVAIHDKRKNVNLPATVPDWQRFKPLHNRPDNVAAPMAGNDDLVLRAQTSHAAPNDPNEQERAFERFLEWDWKQGRR
jgi:hypothetical protein